MAVDLKSRAAVKILERLGQMGRRHDRQHAASRAQAPQAGVRRRRGVESPLIYADLTGYGDKGPDANLPGFDITAYWLERLALADTGCRRSADVAGRGQRRSTPPAVGIYSAIVTGAVSARAHRQGLLRHDIAPREGVWPAASRFSRAVQRELYPLHDRKNPPSMLMNVYRASG